MCQSNRIWRPMVWNIVGHIQLWKQWKPLRAKMDGAGWERRKEGAVGALTMTKKGPGGGGHGRGFISTAFCQEPVLMLKKFMALHSFIAPVCNYSLLWLSLFTRDTSESEAHLLILIRFMTDADHHGPPHTKVWAVTYKGPFWPQMPLPLPTVMPEIHREPSFG